MAGMDAYVKAMLHFNGVDESTTFTDESGKTWTARGTAQLDTAQKEFGTASGLFDGNSDWIDTPDHADWNLSNGSFTIDFWIRFNALPGASAYQMVWVQRDAVPQKVQELYLYNNAGTYQWIYHYYVNPTWTTVLTKASPGLSTNTWYHIALVRDTNNWYVFQDGTQCGTTVSNSNTLPDVAGLLYIGQNGDGAGYVNGWMDEFRLSKGIARWTSNFTPPTAEYGYDFTHTPSDIVSIADSPTKVVDFQRSISDAITIADSPSKAIAIPRADTITISDLAAYFKATLLFLADTVAITDSFSKVSGFNSSKSDSIAIADTPAKAFGMPQADTLAIANLISKGFGLPQADSLAIADVLTTKDIGLGRADTISIADALVKVMGFALALSDTVTIADMISKGVGISFADTISVVDGYGRLIGSADVSVYSDVETDYFHLSKFTAEFTGNVNQFRIRSLGTHNVKVALYDDNAGEPGNLMNAVNTPQLVVSDWNRIPFPSTAIVKGTDYWLAFNSE